MGGTSLYGGRPAPPKAPTQRLQRGHHRPFRRQQNGGRRAPSTVRPGTSGRHFTLLRQTRTTEGAKAATSARTPPPSQPAAERRPAGTQHSTARHLRADELSQTSLSPAGDQYIYRHCQTDSDQAQAQRASNRAAAEFHMSSLRPGGLRPFRISGTSGSVSPGIAASRPQHHSKVRQWVACGLLHFRLFDKIAP